MSKASIETDMRDYGLSYPISKQTNADRIRNMTDEELADWLQWHFDTYVFNTEDEVLKWLQAEVKEGGEDE